jgi:hypothetical protein
MPRVKIKFIMLNVVMLNVVMLSVAVHNNIFITKKFLPS